MTAALFLHRHESPLGTLLLVTDEERRLLALDFADYEDRMRRLLRRYHGTDETADLPAPTDLLDAIDAYFDGDPAAFDSLIWSLAGSAFQKTVWTALLDIPAGQTMSYSAFASHIGRPSAVRAVGMANGANPIAIVLPCHRVIGANGALTGYGGGIERKAWLLEHEGAPVRHVGDAPRIMAA